MFMEGPKNFSTEEVESFLELFVKQLNHYFKKQIY